MSTACLYASIAAAGFFISTYSCPMSVHALRYRQFSRSAREKYVTAFSCCALSE